MNKKEVIRERYVWKHVRILGYITLILYQAMSLQSQGTPLSSHLVLMLVFFGSGIILMCEGAILSIKVFLQEQKSDL